MLRAIPSARTLAVASVALALSTVSVSRPALAQTTWVGHGGNPQHTALSIYPTQSMDQVVWQTPVDLNPQYSGSFLLIHYGSPLCTASNTIVVPVKTGATDGFRVEARKGRDGTLLWQLDSDYSLAQPFGWTPSFQPALTPNGRLYMAGAGGTVLVIDNVDTPGAHTATRLAFYGIANYNGNPAAFAADVKICTPLQTDAAGNIYFGYRASGANPLSLTDGFARIGNDGVGSFRTATSITSGTANMMLTNCAPALSNDGATVYTAIRRTARSNGVLVAMDAATLATTTMSSLLRDPQTDSLASLTNDGTSSPMVGPDNRIYFGVLGRPQSANAARGWLLQFNTNLESAGSPGAFGWDNTPSVVPRAMVPSYSGSSNYLLMCKYNFYAGVGDGVNKIAILDPNQSQTDVFSGKTVMKEIVIHAGVTPDSAQFPAFPNAVKEWCINSAAVDPATNSVLANCEDGKLYRWHLPTNTFPEIVTLTPGLGEAYTPTTIGRDGRIYAINNATLFSVGWALPTAVGDAGEPRSLALSAGPNPFGDETTLRFALPEPARVRLDIVDASGRRVASVVDEAKAAGTYMARWDGRDGEGRRQPAGIYFARLVAGDRTATRTIARIE